MDEKAWGRLAGLLYLVVVATGLFCLAYVPSRIGATGDPQATLAGFVAHAPLIRLGIAAFLVMQVAFLLLPLALYRLFRAVDRNAAVLMLVFAVASVPLGLSALVQRLDALAALTDPSLAGALGAGELQAAAQLSLASYRSGLTVTSLFWGLWLLPLGYLVLKSGYLPKLLGVMLVLGCFGYLTALFGGLLWPGYADTFVADYARLPGAIGEIGTCLWLLLFGIRSHATPRTGAGAD